MVQGRRTEPPSSTVRLRSVQPVREGRARRSHQGTLLIGNISLAGASQWLPSEEGRTDTSVIV